MQPVQHYKRGEELMVQAETATDPSRLIGLAQAHFMAAQTGLMGKAHTRADGPSFQAWENALARTVVVDPDGRIRR